MAAKTFSEVLPVDASGTPTTDQPLGLADTSRNPGGLYGVYVQDEWRVLPKVTINAGLRLDTVEQFGIRRTILAGVTQRF